MTQQPQIKKYRRRVSEEQIKRAAKAICDLPMFLGKVRAHAEIYAKAALEADAKVIEGQEVVFSMSAHLRPRSIATIYRKGMNPWQQQLTEEQFNAEWEEVK